MLYETPVNKLDNTLWENTSFGLKLVYETPVNKLEIIKYGKTLRLG